VNFDSTLFFELNVQQFVLAIYYLRSFEFKKNNQSTRFLAKENVFLNLFI